jgi:hypothetical protein
VVLNEFPEWLQRSIDRIKDTNNKLKRIANEKKESRLSVFQGGNNIKKGKKKNNSDEDDVTFGPRDCDIGIQLNSYVFIHVEIVNILFFKKLCISPSVHHHHSRSG